VQGLALAILNLMRQVLQSFRHAIVAALTLYPLWVQVYA
jgi:hypothetical protein